MTKRIYLLSFLLAICFLSVNAQDDAFVKTGISDEMTKDPEQNKMWRMGQTNYSAKPKSAWELGVHVGHAFIAGDVDNTIPGGYGVGLHLRKALHYVFSIRGDLFYGQMTGKDPQPWKHSSVGGGLIESTFSPYGGAEKAWFPSHKTTYMYGALQGVINIGNLLFHKDRNKWNWYATVGVGIDHHTANLDLLGADGLPYADLIARSGFTIAKFDTKEGRAEIKEALDGIYDGVYETEGFKKKGIFRLGDETNVHVVWTTSMGISRKISKRINIGLEHQLMVTDNDYLDGIKFRTALDQTNSVDLIYYTNIRLGINLGNLDKVTEPLYWLNPLDATFNDIAELKQRPVLDLTDEDGDGIIDMLDQELDTPAGCPVDTRGVTLDSDGDGFADCKDEEPYSPPGFDVDSKGVAAVPTITEDDVNAIVDNKTSAMMNTVNSLVANRSDCGKWFLPMIHFDLDRYNIKPEFYGQLHHVANVMKMCPSVCVSAVGHTDARNSNDYNKVLSFNRAQATVDYLVTNYGIERSRFKLMYGGEDAPMMGGVNAKSESQHYMNRRVEFRVCAEGDLEMGRPEGPNAGKGDRTTRSASGSTYSGNKNSGY
ncbi:MAG: OOP family OmpA-OmpF porin [Saprospiraceae bacterium]|jgi:OOP family OmpA-OmpF porin